MFKPKYYKDAWDVVVVLLAVLLTAAVILWAGQVFGDEPAQPKTELIVSPWEGVFRAAGSEGAQPLVEVGMHVTPATVVGFIDMDIMQPQRRIEVFAGVEGTVTQVLVQDGEFVAAGQALMVVRLGPEDVLVRP